MRRVAIYAHYDARGEVKRYVLHSLRRLRDECDVVHFRSTAALPAAELAKVAPFCASAELRDNVGVDFSMWRSAITLPGFLDGVDELVLANSSVFGPMRSLRPAFERMAGSDVDFWGMTESLQHTWHLQSYFLVFRGRALRHAAFAAFWEGVLPFRDKAQSIRAYELGLSGWLKGEGLRGAALAPWNHVKVGHGLVRRRPYERPVTNPASCLPFQCLDHGVPFVKVEIFRDNPARTPLPLLRRRMADEGYDVSLVEFDPPARLSA